MPIVRKPTPLPFEDRVRMTLLYEEVVTRLEEMALITARVLDFDPHTKSAVKFNPLIEQKEYEAVAVEIVSTAASSGCYDYREGTCFGIETGKESRRIQ